MFLGAPKYKRKLWSDKEDEAITKLVGIIGECNWGTIAERMEKEYNIKGRTGKQCRERWHNHLAPDVKKEPLTANEENQIFLLHINRGYKWAEIAKELGKRTDNAIKNHFYATLRRYMRRTNKILKSEAFKNLTEYPTFKVTCDYIYKCLTDGKIGYNELKTVDSDKWQFIQKKLLKQLNQKKNENEFKELKDSLNKRVKARISVNSVKRQDSAIDDGSASRRSSRLSTKKRNNYSEGTENFNLYLMLELVNHDPKAQTSGAKRSSSHISVKGFKRVKTGEEKEEVKQEKKKPSNVFSNNSFGETRKPSGKLQNKNLDKFLSNGISDGNESDKDSLDLNIGKKIKQTTKGNLNVVGKHTEHRELSSVSFLQDARNISKTSSIGKPKGPSFVQFNSHLSNNDYAFTNMYGKNISIGFEKFGASPFTRNKTKIFNYDSIMRFGREESDPTYRPSVFNGGGQFDIFDSHLNPFGYGPKSNNNSNPLNISVVREISNGRGLGFTNPQNSIPPFKMDNLAPMLRQQSRNSSTPHISHGNTASFGEKSLRNGKTISQPIVKKGISTVIRRSRSRSNGRSVSLTRSQKGAFSKYKK